MPLASIFRTGSKLVPAGNLRGRCPKCGRQEVFPLFRSRGPLDCVCFAVCPDCAHVRRLAREQIVHLIHKCSKKL